MFFSCDLLLTKDARFAIICNELLNRIPEAKSRKELGYKFSLYLLGQLLFGTVVILDQQISFLLVDTEAVYNQVKRINLHAFREMLDIQKINRAEEAVAEDGACTLKTRKRKREHENDSRWEDIQANYSEVVDEIIANRRLADITLVEDEPLLLPVIDARGDELPPLPEDAFWEEFGGGEMVSSAEQSVMAARASQESSSVFDIVNGESRAKKRKNASEVEMIREAFRTSELTAPLSARPSAVELNEAEDSYKLIQAVPDDELPLHITTEEPPPAEAAPSVAQRESQDSLKLDSLSLLKIEPMEDERRRRRKMPKRLIIDEEMKISTELMREATKDYSDLLAPPHKLDRSRRDHEKAEKLLRPQPSLKPSCKYDYELRNFYEEFEYRRGRASNVEDAMRTSVTGQPIPSWELEEPLEVMGAVDAVEKREEESRADGWLVSPTPAKPLFIHISHPINREVREGDIEDVIDISHPLRRELERTVPWTAAENVREADWAVGQSAFLPHQDDGGPRISELSEMGTVVERERGSASRIDEMPGRQSSVILETSERTKCAVIKTSLASSDFSGTSITKEKIQEKLIKAVMYSPDGCFLHDVIPNNASPALAARFFAVTLVCLKERRFLANQSTNFGAIKLERLITTP